MPKMQQNLILNHIRALQNMYLRAIESIEFQLLRIDFVKTRSIHHTYITRQRLKKQWGIFLLKSLIEQFVLHM